MTEQARIHRYFSGTNSGSGFISLYTSALTGMEKIFVLKGAPGTGKSTLLKSIGIAMHDRSFNVEYLHCSEDTDSLDGVIIPEIKVAIIDGSLPHTYESKLPGVVIELANLSECCNAEMLQQDETEIVDYNKQIESLVSEVHSRLQAAAKQRDKIRESYHLERPSEKLDKLTKELFAEIFQQEPTVRHLFASAITPQGRINFLLNITEPWARRYILKGLPGSGKSELAGKIANMARERGLKVDIYHDPVEVERIEALVVPQLDLAVVVLEPDNVILGFRAEDRVIDLSNYLDKAELEHGATLGTLQRYQDLMQEAVDKLAQVKELNDKLETHYVKAMDFEAVDSLKESILNKILATAVAARNSKNTRV
ncbi:MAG TPA: hypothetical protein VFF14_05060 [Candidatus Deferrimicrobium sp.]|nr:hypothetical protein [Candidatus Deferrimicrobium sp.]